MFGFSRPRSHSHSHSDEPQERAPAPPKSDLQKAQAAIMSKYNRSYRINLHDILAIYGSIQIDSNIANVRIREVDLTSITIGFNHFDFEYEMFKPIELPKPCQTYSEVDDQIMEMCLQSANKTGYSWIHVQDVWAPYRLQEWLLIILIGFMVYSYYFPEIVYGRYFPLIGLPDSLIEFLKSNIKVIYYSTIAIHISEFMLFMLPRLVKHRVPVDYKLEWMFFALLEGYPAIGRFDQLVKLYESGDKLNGIESSEDTPP